MSFIFISLFNGRFCSHLISFSSILVSIKKSKYSYSNVKFVCLISSNNMLEIMFGIVWEIRFFFSTKQSGKVRKSAILIYGMYGN